MADFSSLSESDRQAIANKDSSSLSPQGKLFISQNFRKTQQEPSSLRRFQYAFESAETDVGNAFTYLQSVYPIGKLSFSFSEGIDYKSPEETYGSAYMRATPQQRRDILNRTREIKLEREFPEMQNQEGFGGAAGIFGTIAGSLMSPTTLIPISKAYQGYKGLAAVGAAFGAEYSVLDQLAKSGKIDPSTTLGAAGIGAIAAPATSAIIKTLTPASRRALIERNNPQKKLEAQSQFEEIQNITIDESAKGKTIPEIQQTVRNRMGLSQEKIDSILIKADGKITVPSQTTAIELQQLKSIDAVSMSPAGFTKGLQNILGTLWTEVNNISPDAAARLSRYDHNVGADASKYMTRAKPIMDTMRKVKGEEADYLTVHLRNGDFPSALNILKRYSSTAENDFAEVTAKKTGVLDEIHSRLTNKSEGNYKDIGFVEKYWPASLKDYDDYLDGIGAENKSALTKELAKRAKELGLSQWRQLPLEERDNITNLVMRGYRPKPGEGRLGFYKERGPRVGVSMAKYYKRPEEALAEYIAKTSTDINKRIFFGRSATDKGIATTDIEKSIGSYVGDSVATGKMSDRDIVRLKDLLEIRFGAGEKSSAELMQILRNIGYTTTLANPLSALTQIGDLGMSVYANGMRNTIGAMVGKKDFTLDDIYLNDLIATELGSVGKTAKFLDYTLRFSGFKAIDKLGKETIINGAYRRYKGLAKTESGIQKIRKKYGTLFGDEFSALVNDLQSGAKSENIKMMLASELSGYQPTTLSQMPVGYLKAPNGRTLYMLKTFAIKQLDVMRRDVVQEFKQGDKREAGKKLLAYMTIMPMMGATVQEAKDLMLGRGANPEEIIKDNYVENIFKTFGGSEYLMDRYVKRGSVGSAIGEIIAPPLDWIDAIGTDVAKTLTGEFVGEESKSMRQAPVVGRIWYNFIGGGLEKYFDEQED
jgi:hypothetical protein